jgi:ABC-2 type transport system permease protein
MGLTMFERIKHMFRKEFIQIFRDPKMRAMILLVPILQTLLFGYAVTMDVRHVSTAVYDADNSSASRRFVDAFIKSGYFNVVTYLRDEKEINQVLDRGMATCVFCIDYGFEGTILAGKQAYVQAIIDGVDSNTANIVETYIQRITTQLYNKYLVIPVSRITHKNKQNFHIQMQSRAWFNANLESRNYYVPGVIATLVTLVTLTLTSMAIVREKEIGTMEQIIVTPIKKMEFIIGKMLPFIIIGFLDVTIILIIGTFWFDVPVRGNILLLFLAAALYLLTTLGVGLFISAISQTQQQAMMSAFLFYFPAVLLSGFLFPIGNMPLIIQWLTYLNPLRYFVLIIRSVFLKGIGLEILWPYMLTLALMGIFTLWQASRFFRKTTS